MPVTLSQIMCAPCRATTDTHYTHYSPPHSLVGLCVVLVVLDAPWLKGVDQGHEGQCAHNVLQQLVGAEAAVATVVADHEKLCVCKQKGNEGREEKEGESGKGVWVLK